MVRTLPHPSSDSPWSRLDATRIAGNSLAIAVHVVVFGLLALPSSFSPPLAERRPETTVVVYEPVPPRDIPVTVAPPERLPQPDPRPVNTPIRITTTPIPAASDAPVFEQGEIFSPPSSDTGPEETSFDPGEPSLATLAYDVAPPPRYPRIAARTGLEGTVTLRVLVDANGRPVEVAIERSSGHRELDRAARDQVLAQWRFHPAQRDGRAVSAYALVPVVFKLP